MARCTPLNFFGFLIVLYPLFFFFDSFQSISHRKFKVIISNSICSTSFYQGHTNLSSSFMTISRYGRGSPPLLNWKSFKSEKNSKRLFNNT